MKSMVWASAGLLLTMNTQAFAQEAAAGATDQASAGLEDIVVTATRREERLQQIPVSVTAITAKNLGSTGITDVRSLTAIVPGFNGGRNFGVSQPVIRGVGSAGTSPGDESNVAVYIDGIYQTNPYTTLLELVEVERVEVLRGPQGTIFGRNATGGLINIITPDPSYNLKGHVGVRAGLIKGRDDLDLRGYVTGGLTDKVAIDFSGLYRRNGGYITDLVNGGRLGQSRVGDLRSKLMIEPAEGSKIVLTVGYADSKDNQANAVQPYLGNTRGALFPGNILPTKPWQAALNIVPVLAFKRYSVSLRTNFELGIANLETTTAYQKSDVDQKSDSDASPIPLTRNTLHVGSESYSQEIRLLSSGNGPFKWIIGAYGFKQDVDATVNFFIQSSPTSAIVTNTLVPDVSATSYAGFAEGTYQLLERLFLTGGARYSWEKRTFATGNGVMTIVPKQETTFNKWTYHGALRFELNRQLNLYASYSTGFKSGVYNAFGTSSTATKPETIEAVEFGIKADPLPWLRTNLSVFHYSYNDLQVQARATDGASYVLQNAASAKIKGGEIEVLAALNKHFNVRLASAYVHPIYSKFPLAQTYVPTGLGGNLIVTSDVSGNDMIRAPRWTVNLGADWTVPVANGDLVISGSIFHSAKVYHDFLNIAVQKPYTLLTSEIAWTNTDKTLRLSLWGTNLTNAKVFQQITPGPLGTYGSYEKPRRIGVGAQFNF